MGCVGKGNWSGGGNMRCEGDGDKSSPAITLQWGYAFWVGMRGREVVAGFCLLGFVYGYSVHGKGLLFCLQRDVDQMWQLGAV